MRRRLAALLLATLLVGVLVPASGGAAERRARPADGPGSLRAGAAEGLLRVPVGTPLGGYLRPPVGGEHIPALESLGEGDPQPLIAQLVGSIGSGTADDGTPLAPLPEEARVAQSPYATYSPPSRGYYDALVTKAVALDDGDDVVVLVKNDLIGMVDELVQDVGAEVRARTGLDVTDGLVLSATHTHDGPGALANDSVRYFWLAMDAYHPQLYQRLVGDVAAVVADALDRRVPARFGYSTGLEAGQKPLNSFRRSRSPYDAARVAQQDALRRRIGVLRVDELDRGTGRVAGPLAVVVNYAAHGIAFDVENQLFSGDVLGSVEREVEAGFDRPVVAMLVQNTGGDVSPRADGKPTLQRIERFGKLLAPQVRAIYDGVDNFDTAPDVEAVSQRVALNRQALGYAEGEYPYEWGAVQCNGGPVPEGCIPAPPPDAHDVADNGHAENGSFVPLDTRLTAVRIGKAVLLAQPGEPLTEYGLRVLERSPFGYDNTFIWGYAQDHVGYLLPDLKEDWLLGGTEGTTTFWGWKLGGRLQRANEELMAALAGGPAPADELTVDYGTVARPGRPVAATLSARPGRTIHEPESIERFATTSFVWEGGDPVVDLPVVRLEHQRKPGQWVAARRPDGRAIDRPYEYHLGYRLVSGAHQWTATFEAPRDWPAGVYRFNVSGTARDATGDRPYDLESRPFAVAPSASLQASEPARSGTRVEVTLAYTPRPDNYRLIDAEVPADVPAPVRLGAVTFRSGRSTAIDKTAEVVVRDGVTVAVYSVLLPDRGPVTVAGVDGWGNRTG